MEEPGVNPPPPDEPPRGAWAKALVPLLSLAVMAGILATLLAIVLTGWKNPSIDANTRRWMARFALVCVAMLGLTLIVIFWMIVRLLAGRFQPPARHTRTEHVDAWALAGKRLKVSDEPEGEETDTGEGPDDPEK